MTTKILDILTTPWAITAAKKAEIDGIYATHLRGEKIDIKGVEAALGRPLNNQPQGYSVQGGVAVMPIEGIIAKKMNLFTQISGGVSTQFLQEQFQAAMDDPAVKAILLVIDSPGGAVDGTQELADLIFESRGDKPIVALADGLMASAAYWIGSAADQVFAANDTTAIGSIGVVASHVDVSGYESQRGIKTTEITAGKYKRIASEYAALTPEGRQSIQDQLDHIYGVFLGAVARNRGADSADLVHDNMADGRIFLGQQAVNAGLVDGVATFQQLMADLTAGNTPGAMTGSSRAVSRPSAKQDSTNPAAGVAAEPETNDKENHMDLNKLKAEHPTVYEAAFNEGKAAASTETSDQLKAAEAKGATAERERIQGVFGAALPGHEALIEGLAFDGKTTPGDAAQAVLKAEREKKAGIKTDLRADAPNPAPHIPAKDNGNQPEGKDTPKGEGAILAGAAQMAAAAQKYHDEQHKAGNPISMAEAVAHIQSKKEA